jgi:large subunit ribosomal protein L17
MRHGKKFNKLGRQKPHREAMLSNMAASLIKHKRINTTIAKAKALRVYVEPIITRSKEDSTHSRREVFRYLQDKSAVMELFRDVAPKVADRPGGYTRIIKLDNRLGDNAEMCMMELVDFNELMLGGKEAKKAKTTRRGKKKGAVAAAAGSSEEKTAGAEETAAEAKPKKASKKKADDKKEE